MDGRGLRLAVEKTDSVVLVGRRKLTDLVLEVADSQSENGWCNIGKYIERIFQAKEEEERDRRQ